MIIEIFLKTAAMPAVLVAILSLLFGRAPEPWRARIQALFLTIGFWVGCYQLSGRPDWPPPSGAGSLVWVAVWMMLFPWAAAGHPALRYMLRGIWIVSGACLALWSLRVTILNSPIQCRNLIALGCLGWGMWSILERSLNRVHVATTIAMPMLSFTAASLLFLFKGSLLMSQMLTTMAVITGALTVAGWWFPQRLSAFGILPFLGAFFGVILMTGYIFLDIDPWLLIAMAIPFGFLLLKTMIGIPAASALSEAMVCTVLSAVPLGYVLWSVFQTSGPLY